MQSCVKYNIARDLASGGSLKAVTQSCTVPALQENNSRHAMCDEATMNAALP